MRRPRQGSRRMPARHHLPPPSSSHGDCACRGRDFDFGAAGGGRQPCQEAQTRRRRTIRCRLNRCCSRCWLRLRESRWVVCEMARRMRAAERRRISPRGRGLAARSGAGSTRRAGALAHGGFSDSRARPHLRESCQKEIGNQLSKTVRNRVHKQDWGTN